MAASTTGYGVTAKTLHWITVLLLIFQYLLGWIMPAVRRGTTPDTLISLHMSFGLIILLVVVLRFLWRVTHPVPPEASLPAWQRFSSDGLHWLLYAIVAATTLTGWIFASARGWSITIFGVVPLPRLVAENAPIGRSLGELHATLIWVLLGAVAAHVAAALLHLVVYRDRIVRRMLPGFVVSGK